MRKNYLLFALCAFLVPISMHAEDYTVCDGNVKSFALPIYMGNATNAAGSFYGSITQQIYLAEELSSQGISAGDITAVTFYYTAKDGTVGEVAGITRNIAIYLMEVDASVDEYEIEEFDKYVGHTYKSYFLYGANNKAGTKVYDGSLSTSAVTTEDVLNVKLNFSSSFAWSGTNNIVMTVVDKTASSQSAINLRFLIASTKTDAGTTSHPRFLDTYWISSTDERASWITDGNYNFSGKLGEIYGRDNAEQNTASEQASRRSYAAKVTFSITPAAVVIPVPENLSTTSVTTTSARLLWDAVDGATGYNVQWGTNSGSLDHSASNVSNTYLDIDELQDGTTYYFAVQTITAGGTSAYSDAASFNTTAILHEHDGISFSKWNSANSLPSSVGNYYLSTDVVLPNHYTVPGNINLCLNGHNIYTDVYNIVVPDEKTLTIYDNVGGGRIYGYYVGTNGSYYGLISVDIGGTFVLNGGSVENLADQFNNAGEVSYGIYNNGTLKLSGAPAIIGYHGDIYLASSKYVTIESGKPLTNTTPYSLFKLTIGPFTIGWENMGGAKPSAHFIPKNEFHGVCYNSGTREAEIVRIFSTSDNNASIQSDLADGTYRGTLLNFRITSRSFTSAQYNTICLPFALSNAQLADIFGAGYDLEEFASSSLEDDVLSLTFNKVSSLVAGKPYLLKPSVDVANPVFDGVTFYISEPVNQTSDANISFHGTFGPTSLEGGNKNLLFLGADNELFWPAEGGTNTIKGFRAYFEVKGGAAQAAKRARIVVKEDTATGMESIQPSEVRSQKILRDGQLIILRGDKEYNAQGQVIK